MLQTCTGNLPKPNSTIQGFSIVNFILLSCTLITIGLMIAIKNKAHTEIFVNQQGPKNLDSFWLNSVVCSLAIYFAVSSYYLNRYKRQWLMPCPSMGPKWFWTVQINLVEYRLFCTCPIRFGWVQIILDRCKL